MPPPPPPIFPQVQLWHAYRVSDFGAEGGSLIFHTRNILSENKFPTKYFATEFYKRQSVGGYMKGVG